MQSSTDKVKINRPSGRRADILNISTGLFLENGFAATSMAKVAQAVGLTKASLYHHFSGKEELFAACVTEGLSGELATLEDIANMHGADFETKMRAIIGALYDIFILSPAGRMCPLIAEVSRSFPDVARAFHDGYISPQHAILVGLIDEGVAAGHCADIDRVVCLHMVFGPIVTLSLSREMFATFEDLDQILPIETLRQGHIENTLKLLAPTSE